MELKKIGALSLAKITCLFGVLLGLFVGIVQAIIYSQVKSTPDMLTQLGLVGILGYWNILVFPIIYTVIYFIVGILTAWVYNLLAQWIGGINLEFKK